MGKYFVVNEDSGLYADYFAWKNDRSKISDAFKKVCDKFGIETTEFYLDKNRLHSWRERLFDIDGKLYGSIESKQDVNMPDFVTEIKASEFYKVIEDYEERCES